MRFPVLCIVLIAATACNLRSGQRAATLTVTVGVTESPDVAPTSAATLASAATATTASTGCTPRADWTAIYTVVAGDTLGTIARRAGSTVADLASGNCLTDPDNIAVGQQIRLPQTSSGGAIPSATQASGIPGEVVQQGSVSISSIISADAGLFSLLRGDKVTLTWSDPPAGLSRASFYLVDPKALAGPTAANTLIGDDTSPADGLAITWTVPAGLDGEQLVATGRFASSTAVASSYSVNVFSAPPYGQGCTLTAANSSGVTAYMQPEADSAVFGALTPDTPVEVLGRSLNGWYGFDPGIAQAGNTGVARLRWLPPDAAVVTQGKC